MTEKATFAIELEDHASGPAKAAARSLEQLKQKIQAEEAAIRDLQQAMGRLKGATVDVSAQKRQMTQRLGDLKGSLGNAQSQYLQLGGRLDQLKTKSAGASNGLEKTGESATKAGSGAQSAASAIVKVALTIAAAVSSAYVAMTALAIKAFDAARTMRITAEAFTGSAENAGALSAQINSLGRGLPQTRAELFELAQSLSEGGLAGADLVASLKSVATAGAVLPNTGAKIKSIIEGAIAAKRLVIGANDLRGSGISLDDIAAKLAPKIHQSLGAAKQALQSGSASITAGLDALNEAVDSKFGKLAKERSFSFGTLIEKAKDAFSGLFSKIDFQPLFDGIHDVLSMLDETTSSGKAIRELFADLFGGAGRSAGVVAPIVKGFLKGLIMGALMVELAYFKVKIALKKLIPPDMRPKIDLVRFAITAGKVAAIAFAAALGAVAWVAAAAVAAVLPFAAPLVAVGTAIYFAVRAIGKFGGAVKDGIIKAVDWVKNKISGAVEFIFSLPGRLFSAGKEMISQFAEGIASAIGAVTDALDPIGNAVSDALNQHPTDAGKGVGRGLSGVGRKGGGGGTSGVAYHVEPASGGGTTFASTRNSTSNTTVAAASPTFNFHGMGEADKGWFKRELTNMLQSEANSAGVAA